SAPESLFVLAFEGETVVGASTGVPMDQETEAFRKPFVESGRDPARIFYFGESVLLAGYRGCGIGVRFFEEREAYARRLGRFDHCCCFAVERSDRHPLRPADSVPLAALWNRRGYVNQPQLSTEFSWRDIGEDKESGKPMSFWMKELS